MFNIGELLMKTHVIYQADKDILHYFLVPTIKKLFINCHNIIFDDPFAAWTI